MGVPKKPHRVFWVRTWVSEPCEWGCDYLHHCDASEYKIPQNSVEIGKFHGLAQNSTICRKLWSLVSDINRTSELLSHSQTSHYLPFA